MDKFVLEGDNGDMWYVCEWTNKSSFHIIKIFYDKGKAGDYLDLLEDMGIIDNEQ